jgi:hypothetical protein
MAYEDTIRLYRGNKSGLPTVLDGEPVWAHDTGELYVGGRYGNVRIGYGITPEAYGAKGDGTTDDTVALQAAIDAAEAAGLTVLLTGGKSYAISDPININSDGLTITCQEHMGADIKCTTADSGIVIEKVGGGYLYSPSITNVSISGGDIATVGLKLVDVSEGYFDRVWVGSCVRGVQITGALGVGMMWFNNCAITSNTIGVDIYYGAYADFDRCDFWDNVTNFDIGYMGHMSFNNSWAEKFTTMFLFDHTTAHTGSSYCESLAVRDNHILSTDGGDTHTCRIFKFVGDNNTKSTIAGPIRFSGNNIRLTHAKYIAEVDWDTDPATANYNAVCRVLLEMDGNHLAGYDNTTAWFATDVASPYNAMNKVVFRNNEYPAAVAIQDGSGGTLLGVGSGGLDLGTDNKVLGSLDVADIIPTGSSLAVKGGIATGLNRALWVRGGGDTNGDGPSVVFNPRWAGDAYPTWVGAEVGGVAHDGSYKGNLVFATNVGTNATSSTSKMWIMHDGNVGINDPLPAEKLDVDGNINTTGVVKVDDVQVIGPQAAAEADAKEDYTTGDLDSEAEVIAAINATNTTLNNLLAKLRTHGILAT